MRRKLDNLTFIVDEDFTSPFSVSGYIFHPPNSQNQQNTGIRAHTNTQTLRENIRHKQNAYVEYTGEQEESVIFKGGLEGNKSRPKRRKFLDDLLVLGSILTARNWNLFSRRDSTQYPVVSRNHLEYISKDAGECKKHLDIATSKLQDITWQKQYDNGFHLLMLLNHANILNSESRFLSMIVLWEWLYPHLKNPNGATSNDESENLHEVFSFILKQFWPNKVNTTIFTNGKVSGVSKNIFYVLRNQLAHSGRLPIDRAYAEQWMKNIDRGDSKYLKFFDRLTQIIVLKTLGIDGEDSLSMFNFPTQLDSFLTTGKD